MTVGRLILPAFALALFAVLAAYTARATLSLADPDFVTGYVLIALMLVVFVLRGRKVLSMVPLGRASAWLRLHVVGGILAIGAFWIHTGTVWPIGPYEQLLTLLFYAVSISGMIGYVIQKVYPRRLTQTGHEIVYERLPAALAELRRAAEAVVLECAEKSGSDTLAKYYAETFDHFLQRPRFVWNNVFGGMRGEHWVRHHCATVGRYLSDAERPYLDKLGEILDAKVVADVHYASQSVMKMWLWFHVPVAAALVVLSLWHFLLVNIYGS